MAETRTSIRSSEATVPTPAGDREIVRFGGPCLVAALRMADPIPARQHVALAQLPFAGSHQHVSAQESHQRVAHAYFDTDYFRLPSLFPGYEQRVIDAAFGAIAVEKLPKRLGGLQLSHIDGVRVTKTRSQDIPIHPDEKRRFRAARASSYPRHAGPSSLLRQSS